MGSSIPETYLWFYISGAAPRVSRSSSRIPEPGPAGIAEAEKEKIFERGFGKNTGLGLFLGHRNPGLSCAGREEAGQPGNVRVLPETEGRSGNDLGGCVPDPEPPGRVTIVLSETPK